MLNRCRTILAGVPIRQPFTVEAFVRDIAEARGRPLHLHAADHHNTAGMPCGVWLATEDADHIFYERQTSRLHQEHIILHEIGHMLGGHSTVDSTDLPDSRELFPDLDPELVRLMLGRVRYDTAQEEEAEMLASLILAASAHGAVDGLAAQFGYRPLD